MGLHRSEAAAAAGTTPARGLKRKGYCDEGHLVITASLFGLIGLAPLLRLFTERHPLSERAFFAANLGLMLACGGLAAGAIWLLASSRRAPR